MIPWRKVWTNVVLDWQLLSARLPGSRLRRVAAKYFALARDAREMTLAGKTLHYDNRFTPALIAGYLHDVDRLARHVPLDSLETMLDIGANVGQLAFALKLRRPDLRVWSFEPNPEIAPLLRRNAAQWSSWNVVEEGVGAPKRIDLHFVRGKSSQGSIHRDNAVKNLDASGAVSVDATIAPLDDRRARELSIPEEIDLLKIDVEGAELDALEHVTGTRPRFVLMEISIGREGAQPLAAFEDVMRKAWGTAPITLWQSPVSLEHGTQERLWRIPPLRAT